MSEETVRKEKHQFHVSEFDGPLDLLLFLIQENKINIYNIDVSLITEQFLEYIADHEAELGELSEFYKMAADLIYIKSRMLLPVTTELDEEYEDPREELVERLLEYQKYKKYTDLLLNGGSNDKLYIQRNENFFAVPYNDSDLFKDVTIDMLLETYLALRGRMKEPDAKFFNIYEEVSIDEKEVLLYELLDQKNVVAFEELVVHLDNRMHIICAFFAILKMATEKIILVSQDAEFGPIHIRLRPEDWQPMHKEIEDIKPAKGKPASYSILTQEALDAIRKEEEKKAESEPPAEEFVGEEEMISLGDDDEDTEEE